jgi:predicted AlkP superfamily phosphohydrolase/phosphomutase
MAPRPATRVLVIGLDSAPPALVFDQFRDSLPNLSGLMRDGVWGPLRSCVPAITVPAWMTGYTSKDPGQLGIYGFRNRADHSYTAMAMADSSRVAEPIVWDILARYGKQSVTVGIPPAGPPSPVAGWSVGCVLTPSTTRGRFTYPESLGAEINGLVGEYVVDVPNFRSDDKDYILRSCYEMTEKRFKVVRRLMQAKPWDFFGFVEIGVDRMHHGFWKDHDPSHHKHEPGGRFRPAIRDYYRYVDGLIGGILEETDERTTVLVASDHGAKKMDGGICINEWLIERGYLVLKQRPTSLTPFARLDVDWTRTVAWGEGGYYGRVFMNVEGREPSGAMPAARYEAVRDELAEALGNIPDHRGRALDTKVFKPDRIYRATRNVAPDLMVYFDDLNWRSVGSVGHGSIYTFENDTGPDDANHAEDGIFILRGPGIPPRAEVSGRQLLDLAPTILERFGYPVPPDMQGKSLLDDRNANGRSEPTRAPIADSR